MLELFPQVDLGLAIPDGSQWFFTIALGVVFAALLLAAIRVAVLRKEPMYLLVLLGGLLATANEPIVDVLGLCFHPVQNNWTVITTYGRPIPLWATFAYPVYFGGLTCLIIMFLRRGVSRQSFWKGVAVIFAVNLVIELPVLASDVYVYYGYQPFKVLGLFPIHWLFINGAGVLLAAVPLAVYPQLFRGARGAVATVLIVPAGQFAGAAIAIPVFSLMNTNLPGVYIFGASALTMALGLWVFDRLGTFAVQQLESQAGGSDALEPTNLRLGVLTEDRMPAGASAR